MVQPHWIFTRPSGIMTTRADSGAEKRLLPIARTNGEQEVKA
jgi:hypothetical protein